MTSFVASMLAPAAGILLAATTLTAADWPTWRGPKRDDHSPDKGLLKAWPETGPKKLWSFNNAGIGYAGFAIQGDTLYTMGARDEKEQLIALSTKDGKELWAVEIGGKYSNNWGDGPRGTPSVDGDHVFALGAQGNLICVDRKKGTIVWKATMQELGGSVPTWGYCESPLIDGGTVLVTPGGSKGTVAALDKKTGKVTWQSSDITDPAHYSSLVPATINNRKQYVQLTEKTVFGVDASSGKVLWRSAWPGRTAVIPTPIVKGNQVYVTSGYGVGCKLVTIDASNNPSDTWENKVMKNHHGGVILVGSHLYGYSDGPGWVCQEWATGKEVWANKSLGKGAVHYADGMLYCIDEGSGMVALVEASPEAWKEKGRFKLDPQTTLRKRDGRIWTHPVVLNGKLYLRDQELVHCYDVKGR